MNQEKIGLFIKNIRIKNNLTQKQLAHLLGVTSQAVSKWENGKNIPDISIIKEISKRFNVDIEEIINGEYNKTDIINKQNNKYIYIIISLLIALLVLILFLIYKNNNSDYNFKILHTNCDNFKISGSIAYNNNKSSIYITNIEYCGGNDEDIYEKLESTLYEKASNTSIKISESKIDTNTTLENFLKNLEFKIDHYSKVCKHFEDNSLYLEIIASKDNKNIIYKIPLKLTNTCSK